MDTHLASALFDGLSCVDLDERDASSLADGLLAIVNILSMPSLLRQASKKKEEESKSKSKSDKTSPGSCVYLCAV